MHMWKSEIIPNAEHGISDVLGLFEPQTIKHLKYPDIKKKKKVMLEFFRGNIIQK